MEVIEVETLRPAAGRRRLPSWWPGAALLAVGAAAFALWVDGRNADDTEFVPPRPDDGVVGPDEAVALAWAAWRAEVATSDCLAAQGFSWTPSFDGQEWIATAAQRLEVEAHYVDIPLREVPANPITLELADLRIEESSTWYAEVSEGGCIATPGFVNLVDQAAIDETLRAAASDVAFKEALAGEAWRQEHPEAWLARWIEAYFAIDRRPIDDPDEAARLLEEAVEIASEATPWAHIGTQYTDLSASAYGVDGEGHVVVIAIEADHVAHPVTWAYGGGFRFQLVCDNFQLFVATQDLYRGGDGADELSKPVWEALRADWCGGHEGAVGLGSGG